MSEDGLKLLTKGIQVQGIRYRPLKLKIFNRENDITDFEIKIFEGKNREIRKLLNFLGLKVIKLERIEYGPFKITNNEKNSLYEVKKNQLKINLEILGFINEDNFWTA